MIDWSIAGAWSLQVRAIAMIESSQDPDSKSDFLDPQNPLTNQARGLFSWHPAAFAEAYGCCAHMYQPANNDSWVMADIKALAGYLELWVASRAQTVEHTLMCFHLGRRAVMQEGKWDQGYLERYDESLNKLRAALCKA